MIIPYQKHCTRITIAFFCLLHLSFWATAAIQDSIGVEKKDGKYFVLHQVEAKETLYSIAKRYSSKVEDIKLANPEIGEGLKLGQTIRVPYKGIVSTLPGTTSFIDLKNAKQHTVEKKETLYSISKKYTVTVEDIIKANPGIESSLKEGQTILIPSGTNAQPAATNQASAKAGKIHKVEPKETLFGISKKYNVPVDDIKKANPELIEGLKEGMEIVIPEKSKPATTIPATSTPVKEKEKENEEVKPEPIAVPVSPPSSKGEFKKVTESGNAELLESKSDAPKFQAHHKTAPIGTIIQVVNEANNEKIFVRVVGKLTEASDGKTIIKISQKAMERLQAKDKKIAVSLTYIP